MPALRTLEGLIGTLRARHADLRDQIAALELQPLNRSHALLLQYVVLRSGRAAADWANAQGWRVPSATGDRAYLPSDATRLVADAPEPVPAALQALARDLFDKNAKDARRRFD